MTTTIKICGATNRAPEVERAVKNFLRWIKDNYPSNYAAMDVLADGVINYLVLESDVPQGCLNYFKGALAVFLTQEGVEVA